MLKSDNVEVSLKVQGSMNKGNRQNQQDKIGYSKEEEVNSCGTLFVLSDGMGGMRDGEKYSAIAVEEIGRYFCREREHCQDMRKLLLESYLTARKRAIRECPDPQDPDGGATVVSVLIRKNQCMFLSVGDSKLYLFRNGGLIQLNREQTTGVLLDINAAFGYIPSEYKNMGFRDTLDNNLCEAEEKEPDMPPAPFELADNDLLLLMSDGITHTLTDGELTDVLNNREGRSTVKMIGEAVEKKGNPQQDNYSIIAVEVRIKKTEEK